MCGLQKVHAGVACVQQQTGLIETEGAVWLAVETLSGLIESGNTVTAVSKKIQAREVQLAVLLSCADRHTSTEQQCQRQALTAFTGAAAGTACSITMHLGTVIPCYAKCPGLGSLSTRQGALNLITEQCCLADHGPLEICGRDASASESAKLRAACTQPATGHCCAFMRALLKDC